MIEGVYSRRRFGLVVTGVLTTMAGCSSAQDESGDSPFVMGAIFVENEREERVQVDLEVEQNGTEAFRDTIALEASTNDVVHQQSIEALQCETGTFDVSAKLAEDDTWTTFTTAEWESSGVFVTVQSSGELAYGQSFGESAECQRTDATAA